MNYGVAHQRWLYTIGKPIDAVSIITPFPGQDPGTWCCLIDECVREICYRRNVVVHKR